nr:MAG TPA: hypothetical protein [Caudoviricetes sp.]
MMEKTNLNHYIQDHLLIQISILMLSSLVSHLIKKMLPNPIPNYIKYLLYFVFLYTIFCYL